MSNKIQFDYSSAMREIDEILKKVEIMSRAPALKKGLRKGANVFKKRYQSILPVSGAVDNRGRTPLAKSIKVKVIDRGGDSIRAIVGEARSGSDKQYIAHILDRGWETGAGRTDAKKYLERAANGTRSEIDTALIQGVKEATRDLT